MNYKEIRAVYTEDTIRVYQAFPEKIANQAIHLGTFGDSFNINRMTWIKPSFFMDDVSFGLGSKTGARTYFVDRY